MALTPDPLSRARERGISCLWGLPPRPPSGSARTRQGRCTLRPPAARRLRNPAPRAPPSLAGGAGRQPGGMQGRSPAGALGCPQLMSSPSPAAVGEGAFFLVGASPTPSFGLRPHPPGLRPGPRPSSEMARQVTVGAAAGGHLLAGRVTGAAEPPPRSRAPPASQAMTLRVTLDLPGEPAAHSGCPTRRCPTPSGAAWRAEPATRRGSWTAQLDRCSIKHKRKNDQTVVPPCGGTVEDNGHPDQSIWGESSLHQTRGAPSCNDELITVRWAGRVETAIPARITLCVQLQPWRGRPPMLSV